MSFCFQLFIRLNLSTLSVTISHFDVGQVLCRKRTVEKSETNSEKPASQIPAACLHTVSLFPLYSPRVFPSAENNFDFHTPVMIFNNIAL